MEERKNKITENRLQTFLFACVVFFVLFFQVPKYIWCYHVKANQFQAGFLLILFIIVLGIVGIMYRENILQVNKISAISLIGMSLFGLISSIWNGDLVNSIYGDEFQGVGLITMICYYGMFFAGALLKRKGYRRWIIYFMCMVLGFICLYGVMQCFHVPFMMHNLIEAAILPTRNQNYFAAFPVLFLGLVMGKIFYDDRMYSRKKKSFWYTLAALGFAAGVASFSLVFYLGFFMQLLLLFFLGLFRKEKRLKEMFSLLLIFLAVFFIMEGLKGGKVLEEFFSLANQIEQAESLLGDMVGSGRMKIWKDSLLMLKEKPFLGCGIEKFVINIGTEDAPNLYSDAHNEYLQIWLEQGIFVITFYLIFLFSLFIPGVLQFIKKDRYKSDFTSKAAMIAFFGYIAQAFANIRVIQVAPYFWLCCGLLQLSKVLPKEED